MNPTLVCKVMGLVFIVIAIWGFITKHSVLIFHVNTAHNLVHLLSGVAALACGFAGLKAARAFCIVFGAVYGVVAVLGFLGVTPVIELLHLNMPDNWLHLFLAALFLATGLMSLPAVRRPPATSPPATPPPAGAAPPV